MSIEIQELQRVAVTEEAAGAANFGIDVTASAPFLDVPVQGTASVELMEPELDPGIQQQRIDAFNTIVFGPKAAKVSLTIPLAPTGVAAGDGDTSPAYTTQGLLMLFKIIYGGANDANTGTDVATVTNAYNFGPTLTSGLDGGESFGWINASGSLEARTIVEGAGSTVTVRDQLSATPSVSDVIFAGTTIYPTSDPQTSVQLLVEGAEEDDRWLLMGGQQVGAPSFNITLGEIPTVTFTLEFAAWMKEPTQTITPGSYGTFAPTFAWESLRVINGTASGSISGACLDAASLSFAFNGPTYVKVPGGCGVNTVMRWKRKRAVPFAEPSMNVPYEDYSWFTEKDDGEYYGIFLQIGNTPGGTVLLDIPRAQVMLPKRVGENGLAYQTLTFKATTDTHVTQGVDDDLRYAAFRIHFL